jgi:hypothetical protein
VSCKQFDDSNATGVVWREVLWGVFSTLGRLRAGRYDHESVRCILGDKDPDRALQAVHELLWSEWIGGSLEQQHADLFLYIRDLGQDGEAILAEQSDRRPFLRFHSGFGFTCNQTYSCNGAAIGNFTILFGLSHGTLNGQGITNVPVTKTASN